MSSRAPRLSPARSARSVSIACAVAFALSLAPSCSPDQAATADLAVAAENPTRFGYLADFSLTERNGATVSKQSLAGSPFIVGFIFTTCAGPCPTITRNMATLQAGIGESGVKLVSISVDPKTDTPERLRAYADGVGADRDDWLFLTGDEAVIYQLLRSSFMLAVERAQGADAQPGFQVTHTTRLVVIDAKGEIAGYYAGETETGAREALDRALALAGETSD